MGSNDVLRVIQITVLLWHTGCIRRFYPRYRCRSVSGDAERKGSGATIKNGDKPIANPYVTLREEFDDWAILFDPDTGGGFGLNPTGVYLWKLLDGKHDLNALLKETRENADNVPEDAGDHIEAFVDALLAEGLAGFYPNLTDRAALRPEACASFPSGSLDEVEQYNYECPRLVNLNSGAAARGTTCSSHGSNGTYCCSGACASGNCVSTGTYANGSEASCCSLFGSCANSSAGGQVCCTGSCAQWANIYDCATGGTPSDCCGPGTHPH